MTAPSSTVTPIAGRRDGRDPYAPSLDAKRRAQALSAAWDAYHGAFRGGDQQWPLLWKSGKEPNPNVIINRCGPAVNTDVSYLMGQSVAIHVKKKPKAAQEYLDQVWGVSADDSSDDDKMALLQELATNGAVTGHAFLKVVWDAQRMKFPRLVVLDSSQVRVICDPHDVKTPVCYIVEYQVPDPTQQSDAPATYRQVMELCDPATGEPTTDGGCLGDTNATWRICEYLKPAHSNVFVLQGAPVEWPYPWAPIDGCPHLSAPNAYYGRPRLTRDVIHINEAICTVASNINKIGLRHAHPLLYTKKMGNNQQALNITPGAILQVSDEIKAVEAHGDLEHLMQFEEDLRGDFDEETHIPAQAFGRMKDLPALPTSGVAMRLGYSALMADIMKERRTYGALLRRVSQHLLELKDESWATAEILLGWQDPLPADDLQQAQVAQVLTQMGVMSKRTAAESAGLDFDAEQEAMKDEAQQALLQVMRGQAMPPAPPAMSGQPGAQPPQSASADDGQDASLGSAVAGKPAKRGAVDPNNPAAQMARQKVKAAFGKS